jgi:vitamin B12 transporter
MHKTAPRPLSLVVRAILGAPVLAALPLATLQAQAVESAMKFELPAGDAEQTLRTFSIQSGVQVLLSTDLVSGVQTNAVSGEYEPQDAARRMLEGTSLQLVRDQASGIYSVEKVAGYSLPDTASDDSGGDVELDMVTVSASRSPMSLRYASSAVSVVSLDDLALQQVDDLRSSLTQVPGITVSNTGAFGGRSAVFIRGAYPQHTLFLVDGIRLNDSAASADNFIGGADLGGIDRMEVLRGPQSTMYGSAAMGGVILMNTAKGKPGFESQLNLTGGSFDTRTGGLSVRGGDGRLGYSASVSRYYTLNDQPNNWYRNWSYSGRLSFEATEDLELGVTFRGQDGKNSTEGSRFSYSPGVAETGMYLGTVYADWRSSDTVTTRLVGAIHKRTYDWLAGSGSASFQENDRKIVDWQTTWKPLRSVDVVVGGNYEDSEYSISGLVSNDTIYSGFVSGVYRVTNTLTVNSGLRYDDFDTVGASTTWKAGMAWMVMPETKLRATYGTGFAAPSSSHRYGVPAWGQAANPDIKPEKSKGWDIGVDHTVLGGMYTVSATYFKNKFTDLIDWQYTNMETWEGIYTNRSKASTEGVELGVSVEPVYWWNVRLGYTYLKAQDDLTGARLNRRPRNSIDVSSWVEIMPRWTAGFGLKSVNNRLESGSRFQDYSVARVYTSYDVNDSFTVKLRMENALDKKYDEVYGYEALPRGVFGSVEVRF